VLHGASLLNQVSSRLARPVEAKWILLTNASPGKQIFPQDIHRMAHRLRKRN
jgi:hypothetical protein